MGDSPVSKAFGYLEYWPPDNLVRVKLGCRELFEDQLYRIIKEEMSIDVHANRITYRDIGKRLEELLIEIKVEQVEGGLSNDPVTEFDRRKGRLLSDLVTSDLNEYTFTFPLNLGLLQPLVEELTILEGEFRPVDQQRWIDDYLYPAKTEDDRFLKEFLQTSPNDFLDNDLFAYFEIEYEARSERYALSRVPDLANLVLGKLNYSLHCDSRGPPKSRNKSALPYETWSGLKEPAFYLVFEEDDYLLTRPMDYGYRRTMKISRRREDQLEGSV
jgi:superfamily I DNA and/or RNA helicase